MFRTENNWHNLLKTASLSSTASWPRSPHSCAWLSSSRSHTSRRHPCTSIDLTFCPDTVRGRTTSGKAPVRAEQCQHVCVPGMHMATNDHKLQQTSYQKCWHPLCSSSRPSPTAKPTMKPLLIRLTCLSHQEPTEQSGKLKCLWLPSTGTLRTHTRKAPANPGREY